MVFRGAQEVSAHQFYTKWCRLIFATSGAPPHTHTLAHLPDVLRPQAHAAAELLHGRRGRGAVAEARELLQVPAARVAGPARAGPKHRSRRGSE